MTEFSSIFESSVMQNRSKMQKALVALKANRFNAVFAASKEDAKETILKMIPARATVGIGDSATVRQIGVIMELEKRGNAVVNPFLKEWTLDLKKSDLFRQAMRKSVGCEVFLTSVNALTMDGKLVDIDGTGNRIAGTIFGPKKMILLAGRNKIVRNVAQALRRIRNVIVPVHAKHKGRDVPCVKTGRCVDCHSKERICNITAIIERQPHMADVTVLLIDEDLGLGWDPSWSEERKQKIESHYKEVSWEHILPWHPKKSKVKAERGHSV